MTDTATTETKPATKPVTTAFTASVIDVQDQLRKTGPLQTIAFPPFPELLAMAVMVQSVKGYAGTLVEALARKARSFVDTENANHKTDHAVVGALWWPASACTTIYPAWANS